MIKSILNYHVSNPAEQFPLKALLTKVAGEGRGLDQLISFKGSNLKTFLRMVINSLMFLDHFHIISSLANQKKKKNFNLIMLKMVVKLPNEINELNTLT